MNSTLEVEQAEFERQADEKYRKDVDDATAEQKLRFRIWNHEREQWWRPNEFGYTSELSEAGLYSYDKALRLTLKANRYELLKRKHPVFGVNVLIPQDSLVPVIV